MVFGLASVASPARAQETGPSAYLPRPADIPELRGNEATDQAASAPGEASPEESTDQASNEEQPNEEQAGEVASEDSVNMSQAASVQESGIATPGGTSSIEAPAADEEASEISRRISLTYYSIIYGPALKDGSRFQPSPLGQPDSDRPVQMRNFLGLGYNLTDSISITPTAYLLWEADGRQRVKLMDPFLRVSHNALINTEHVNLYADVRFHFPVTLRSRDQDLLAGIQSFQALTWLVGDSPVSLALYNSIRYNAFGKQGFGNDLELYFAPHFSYRFTPTLSFTMLYEVEAVHTFGARAGSLRNLGADLEPGINWEVTPNLTFNPYLNLYPQNGFSLKNTSFGMMVYWAVL